MSMTPTKTLSPRRGKTSSMSTTKKDTVLASGEIFIEYPNTGLGTIGAYGIKIGDGTTTYENLPYSFTSANGSLINVTFDEDESSTVAIALGKVISNASLSTIVAALKRAVYLSNAAFETHDLDTDAHVSSSDRTNWNAAYTHSTSAHAPSNAEHNTIESITLNGSTVTPDANRNVALTDTTYALASSGTSLPDGQVAINLTANGTSSAGSVEISGGENASVTTDASGNIVIDAVDTVYVHPDSGIAAGTYNSVTVNAQGHATAGSTGIVFPIPVTAITGDITAKSLIGAVNYNGYKSIAPNSVIDIRYPILYSEQAISTNSTGTAQMMGEFDVSGSTTITTTGRILYAKGLLNGLSFTVNSLTITEPGSEDGYEYMVLGITNGSDKLVLLPNHDIFKYGNGVFGRYSDIGDYGFEDPLQN